MTVRHRLNMARPGRHSRRGFTLVELLLVMFILSVLLALVVGVSWYVVEEGRKRETIVRQKNLLAAIDGYRKVMGKIPGQDPSKDGIYFEPDSAVTYKYKAEEIMSRLLNVLTTGSYSNDKVDPASALYKATGPFLEAGGSATTDAYGNSMLYIKDGGLGGKPVIISAGPDGKFGYGGRTDGSSTIAPVNKQQQKDNIRSDTN